MMISRKTFIHTHGRYCGPPLGACLGPRYAFPLAAHSCVHYEELIVAAGSALAQSCGSFLHPMQNYEGYKGLAFLSPLGQLQRAIPAFKFPIESAGASIASALQIYFPFAQFCFPRHSQVLFQ